MSVALARFRWGGALAPAHYESSPGVTRSFCPRCGTPLAYYSASSPAILDITLGSLDDAGAVRPIDHIWMDDAVSWDRPGDGRPAHPRTRPA